MRSITTWTFKPEEPLRLAACYADLEGTALLFSGLTLDASHQSFLCLHPDKKVVGNASWEQLRTDLGTFSHESLPIPKWIGYLGYEMGATADSQPIDSMPHSPLPDYCFYRPTVVVHYNHKTAQATLYAEKAVSLNREAPPRHMGELQIAHTSDTLAGYLEKIARIQECILDGEVYQVNLSQAFYLQGSADPYTLFERIVRENPSPFSAYLNCGAFSIVSSSPERFLWHAGEHVETRPIKGTAPRGKSPQEDLESRTALLASEKERAELLMITDLMRNDLGKICEVGSVETKEIWRCESYTNVFHLLSIIEGRVSPTLHPLDLIRPLFPGGSVTGCPKLSALEIIAALENRSRGVYTGTIGYISESGDFDFNIAIRTLLVEPKGVEMQLGGAIVIDSDPMKEYEETLLKGESLLRVMGVEDVCLS